MKRRRVHELHSVEVQLVVQPDDASKSRLSHEGSIFRKWPFRLAPTARGT